VILARYGARITWHDLSDRLLKAVDEVLSAHGGAMLAAIDRLRAVRRTMVMTAEIEAKKK
jgi:hypothetical protein